MPGIVAATEFAKRLSLRSSGSPSHDLKKVVVQSGHGYTVYESGVRKRIPPPWPRFRIVGVVAIWTSVPIARVGNARRAYSPTGGRSTGSWPTRATGSAIA